MRNVGLLLFFALEAVPALAKSPSQGQIGVQPEGGIYEILNVVGEVRVWRRFGASWTPLAAGDRLVAGELIQMTGGSDLKLKGVASATGRRVPRGFSIRSDEPLITRVEDASLREMSFGGYFMAADVTSKGGSGEPDVETTPFYTAWERMVSVFDEKKDKPEDSQIQMAARLGDPSQDPIRDDVREIKINHPRSGDTYLVGELPTEVAVSWSEMPKGVRSLKIFLWQSDRGKPALIGRTDKLFFRLPIAVGGRYYVRVESPDGRWRSKSHLFIVMTPEMVTLSPKGPKRPDAKPDTKEDQP